MHIHEAQHGINVVVETANSVVIGRFDQTNGFQAVLHDCAVHTLLDGEDAEEFVRTSARYGFAVDKRDLMIEVGDIENVRVLGDIPKE